MKKAIDFFITRPARFFVLAALLWGGFMCFLNYKDGADFSWHDLLVEANGMIFDLLVFGILLSIYEALRNKRDKIERLHEEIDDYRGWDEKEAMYRIVGAVKRLNKLGVTTDINLGNCYLEGARFFGAKLKRSNLRYLNLEKADFGWAELQGANLHNANLSMANLWAANLQGANLEEARLVSTKLFKAELIEANLYLANLWEADFREANLMRANLRRARLERSNFFKAELIGANLQGANFEDSCLEGANFQGAIVDKDWFEKLSKWNVKGREEIKAKYLIDQKGVLQEKQ
ncbi:MAG: pentapeptide repeat-containing protein [Phycisphaerae bacterium]|nr:pentapeptide repeat-containing protein [Saprospiraceae bacterium]